MTVIFQNSQHRFNIRVDRFTVMPIFMLISLIHPHTLTSQHLPIVMVVALESLAAAFLHQRWTVFAAVLRFLFNYPGPWHHARSAGGVALTPRAPLAHDAIDHCRGVMKKEQNGGKTGKYYQRCDKKYYLFGWVTQNGLLEWLNELLKYLLAAALSILFEVAVDGRLMNVQEKRKNIFLWKWA